MANPGKDKKNKEAREDAGLLRRLMEELAVLREDVESIKKAQGNRNELPSHRAVTPAESKDFAAIPPEQMERLVEQADDGAVARLAYAFASPQKVKIVRILLTTGPLSSAQIGEKTGLTTGSLYHHLRELTHAEVIEQSGRNLHAITPLGRRTALFLFQLV